MLDNAAGIGGALLGFRYDVSPLLTDKEACLLPNLLSLSMRIGLVLW